jgi:hypothetical protein
MDCSRYCLGSCALGLGAGFLLPLVGRDGLTQCGAFGLVLGVNERLRATIEANYRPPVEVGGWWSAAKWRQKNQAERLLTIKGERE